jgi:hypothetical protein
MYFRLTGFQLEPSLEIQGLQQFGSEGFSHRLLQRGARPSFNLLSHNLETVPEEWEMRESPVLDLMKVVTALWPF